MKFICVFALFLCLLSVSAQEYPQSNQKLIEDTNNLIALHVPEEVGQFTQYLQDIANKKLPIKDRYKYVDLALSLFVGNGLDYWEYVLDEKGNVQDSILRKAVSIEITDLRRNRKVKRPLRTYLKGLADIRYEPVTIETIQYHLFQMCNLCSYKGNTDCIVDSEIIRTYGNDTISPIIVNRKKRIPCNNRTEIVETDDGIEYLPKFGNITATKSFRM